MMNYCAKIILKNPMLDKYVLILRDNYPTIIHPNRWDLVGGNIEQGETPFDAALREKNEEIGPIQIYDIAHLMQLEISETFKGKEFYSIISLFFAKTNSLIADMRLSNEGQKIDYFSLDKILEIDAVPMLKEFIVNNGKELIRR